MPTPIHECEKYNEFEKQSAIQIQALTQCPTCEGKIWRITSNGTTDGPSSGGSTKQQDIVAVVVGSGAIGIEQAIAYRNRGVEVHLIEMRDHLLPHLLDTDMSDKVQREIEDLGIHLHLNTSLERIEGKSEAEVVHLSDGTRLTLQPGRDLVVLAIGMRPDVDFLNPDEIRLNRGRLFSPRKTPSSKQLPRRAAKLAR